MLAYSELLGEFWELIKYVLDRRSTYTIFAWRKLKISCKQTVKIVQTFIFSYFKAKNEGLNSSTKFSVVHNFLPY